MTNDVFRLAPKLSWLMGANVVGGFFLGWMIPPWLGTFVTLIGIHSLLIDTVRDFFSWGVGALLFAIVSGWAIGIGSDALQRSALPRVVQCAVVGAYLGALVGCATGLFLYPRFEHLFDKIIHTWDFHNPAQAGLFYGLPGGAGVGVLAGLWYSILTKGKTQRETAIDS